MSVALHGNLKDFGIAEVFQLIGHQAKSGILEITCQDTRVQLRFDGGSVVDATPLVRGEYGALADLFVRCGLLTRERAESLERESEESATPLPALIASSGEVDPLDLDALRTLLTQETIFTVLRWSGGSFHFKAQAVTHDRPFHRLLGAEQILMDGLRMVDEWGTFLKQVPSEDLVFRRTGPFEVHRSKCGGEAQHRLQVAERVFLLVDGRLTVRRVIDLSRLGTFEATRLLAELRQSGVIEPVEPARRRRASSARPRARLAALVAARMRATVMSALALIVLAGLALQTREGGLGGAPVAGFPLPSAPLERAPAVFGKRALHNAAQAFRYAHDRWPESLEELRGSEFWPREPDSLASPEWGSYYYARRGDGILLLAPESRPSRSVP